MKPADLARITIVQTPAIAKATADPETMRYVQTCLSRCFSGDWGSVPAEDAALNDEEIEAGEGRILAAYPQHGKLTGKIWIIAYFSASFPDDVNYNNVTILYPDEY